MAYNTLDSTTSIYNITHHIPAPTVAFYEALTGINLVTEGDDTETVNKKLLGLTLQARDYLFQDKSERTRFVMEYLIAFYPKWRLQFITYAVRFIEATYTIGDEHIVGNKDIPRLVKNAMTGLLNTYHFDYDTYYMVDNSEDIW